MVPMILLIPKAPMLIFSNSDTLLAALVASSDTLSNAPAILRSGPLSMSFIRIANSTTLLISSKVSILRLYALTLHLYDTQASQNPSQRLSVQNKVHLRQCLPQYFLYRCSLGLNFPKTAFF